jgi:splicing factor 3B subunit 2
LKRKYLSAKRGIEQSQYRLPDYVEATGITKMRDALQEIEQKKSRKQKQRDRARPKLGRVSMDFRMLHDAFFVHQTKPDFLSIHGDIYYEGKEDDIRSKKFKPGVLSAELKEALGMQRFGPPPSYPNMKVPGVNAPIPARLGAQYGFMAGGWGKAPVDEVFSPLFFRFPFNSSSYLLSSYSFLVGT